MTVRNEEKKAFRDMTPEERGEIVEALLSEEVEVWSQNGWMQTWAIQATYAYRTRTRQLVIPWEVIKPEYKWAAMDEDGHVYVFIGKPQISATGDWWHDRHKHIDAVNIDTTGIDWRESLTERPEGV